VFIIKGNQFSFENHKYFKQINYEGRK